MFEIVAPVLYGLSFLIALFPLVSLWKLGINDLPSRIAILVGIVASAIGVAVSISCIIAGI